MQRERRLRRSVEFQAVQQKGEGWRDRFLILRAAPNGRTISRFGFTVATSIGNAVVRNRVKRRLREAVRHEPVKAGWDLVFIARRETATADFQQLHRAVTGLLRRAGLLEGRQGQTQGEERS